MNCYIVKYLLARYYIPLLIDTYIYSANSCCSLLLPTNKFEIKYSTLIPGDKVHLKQHCEINAITHKHEDSD